MRLGRTVMVLALLLAASAAFAEVKIGIVDIQKILVLSDPGKAAKDELAAKAASYDNEKNQKEEELKKLKAELERQSVLLSESARSAKEREYQQKLREYQRFMKDAQDDLQLKNDELTNRIGEEIVKMVQEYGKKNGYTTILIKNDAMIYTDESIDLTDTLLRQFNQSQKKK